MGPTPDKSVEIEDKDENDPSLVTRARRRRVAALKAGVFTESSGNLSLPCMGRAAEVEVEATGVGERTRLRFFETWANGIAAGRAMSTNRGGDENWN
jgi:hypothetical protein